MKRSIRAMLGDLIYSVTGHQSGRQGLPADRDTENAVASILALAAMSDGIVSTEEIERLVSIPAEDLRWMAALRFRLLLTQSTICRNRQVCLSFWAN